jgi:hypothetical protein
MPTRPDDHLLNQHPDEFTTPGKIVGVCVPFLLSHLAQRDFLDMPVGGRPVKLPLHRREISL